ncbi:MAG: group II intron reverse transcriptase/maturase [Myxococcales bacterium]|nr:group II intron reverse transcriptase/maturase [Myxococcales bacterium]
MVRALEDGVKGSVWYTLWDKFTTLQALESAFAQVKANDGAAGVDHVSVRDFERDRDKHLKALCEALRNGSYRPAAIRRRYIPKVGGAELRPLGIPTVRDRVVQTALRAGIEPIFEREFADQSYGFRPRRNAHQAIDRVERLLNAGLKWVVDVDLKSYFDTVSHPRLMALVRRRIADGRVLGLIEEFLKQPVDDEGQRWTPIVGTPQGAVMSPLLANVFLDPLDHLMAKQGYEMTRYADDFVIQCRTEDEARRALEEVARWCGIAELTLHPTKTRIALVTVREGIDFLGYHFREHRDDPRRTKKWPRKKSVMKLRERLRPLTRRTNGGSLNAIVKRVNVVLRGFLSYFIKSVRTPLDGIDRWVRGRLRSILRRRSGKRGRGGGLDSITWPNAFFVRLGLLSLASTPVQLALPLTG